MERENSGVVVCPHCKGTSLYAGRSWMPRHLAQKVVSLFNLCVFVELIVCADCGYVQEVIPEKYRQRVRDKWKPVNPENLRS